VKLPGIGDLEPDDDFGWWGCPPIHVPLLDGAACFVVDDEPGAHPAEYAAAILAFAALDQRALEAVSDEAFAYYRDIVRLLARQPGLWEVPSIEGPDAVWQHIRLGESRTSTGTMRQRRPTCPWSSDATGSRNSDHRRIGPAAG
jgi:hypothetical protein